MRLSLLSCVWTLDVERHLHSPFKETSLREITQSTIWCSSTLINRKIVHRAVSQRDCEDFLRIVQNGNFALTYSNNNGDKNPLLPRKFTQTRTCRRTASKIHRALVFALALALALLRSGRHHSPGRHSTSIKRVDKKRLASRRDPMRARGKCAV